MLGLLLADPLALEHLEADSPAVERLLGVDRGRRYRTDHTRPWLIGSPEEDLAVFANLGGLPHLIAVTEDATDEELQAARSFSRLLLDGLATFSKIADAFTGRDNASGMAMLGLVADDAGASAVMVPLFIAMLRAPGFVESIREISAALKSSVHPLEAQAKELATLPDTERAARLSRLSDLPFIEQVRVKRLLEAFTSEARTT
jgi:hypothetical protein